MRHNCFKEAAQLVAANVPILLTGEKGSGKTTLAMQIAEHMEIDFFSLSMTRQTTLSHLMGFMSVNGTYVPSKLREVAESGGAFLLDELDAGDPNVLLSLNTIENGYISFPDGVINLHKDFRLMATSNPQDQHDQYVGRSKLDAATLDRFDIIDIDHDDDLEKSMVDIDVFERISILRRILLDVNSSKKISMRDSIRYQKRKELNLLDKFVYNLTGKNELVHERYLTAVSNIPKYADQSECCNVDDLFDLMKQEASRNKAGKPAEPTDPPPF